MHVDAHQPPPSPPPSPPLIPNEAAEEPQLLESGTFYTYDTRRVTFREYLFETKNPLVFAIAGIARLLRIRIPGGSTDDPNVEKLAPFEVNESAFPNDVRAQLAPLIGELIALGFHTPVFHEITDAPTPPATTSSASAIPPATPSPASTSASGAASIRRALTCSPSSSPPSRTTPSSGPSARSPT